MTIEVRQLLIRATVGGEPAPTDRRRADLSPDRIEALREDLLAECKAWLEDYLQRAHER